MRAACEADGLSAHERSERYLTIHRAACPFNPRALLANIAANPFGPDAVRLADLAYDAGLPPVAQAIEGCTRVYRKRFEEKERLEVAHEIRHLVSISGCSQRRFAKYIGTSAPRLSTYVNGLVTPSASMMLRIRRCASDLAQAPAAANGLKSVG